MLAGYCNTTNCNLQGIVCIMIVFLPDEQAEESCFENGYFSVFHVLPASDDEESSPEEQQQQEAMTTLTDTERMARTLMKALPLNIDGLLRYYHKDYREALGLFQQAVEADPVNLNGLQHCRFVYQELGMTAEADDVTRQMDDIIGSDNVITARAKSLAELGVAVRILACHNFTFISYVLTLAIGMGMVEDGIGRKELAYWKMNLAGILLKKYLKEDDLQTCVELFTKLSQMYCQLACDEKSGNAVRARSLSMLGAFIHRPPSAHVAEPLHDAVRASQVLGGSLKPAPYFTEAYRLDHASLTVCNLYALYLTRTKKFHAALAMMQNVFGMMDPNRPYIEAFGSRGEMNMKLYREYNKKKEYIEKAVKDLTYYAKFSLEHKRVGQLASAYHFLVMHAMPFNTDVNAMNCAVKLFDLSLELLDDRRYTQTHLHHAQCLEDFGYLRLAVESSKRLVENDDVGYIQVYTGFTSMLLKRILQLYQQEGRPDYLMSEFVFWMDYTCTKYQAVVGELRRTLTKLHNHDTPVMTRLYHNLLYNGYGETAACFPKLIPTFKAYCPDPPQVLVPPALPSTACNRLHKLYDFVVLHSASDRPWVYYSLLTKLELQHNMKGYVMGRDSGSSSTVNRPATRYQTRNGQETSSQLEADRAADDDDDDDDDGSARVTPMSTLVEANKADSDHAQSPTDTRLGPGAKLVKHIEAAIKNSVCVIFVLTSEALQGVWFRDGRPSGCLQQALDVRSGNVIILNMAHKLKCKEIFSADCTFKEYSCSEHVPWDRFVKHVRVCCGYTTAPIGLPISLHEILSTPAE